MKVMVPVHADVAGDCSTEWIADVVRQRVIETQPDFDVANAICRVLDDRNRVTIAGRHYPGYVYFTFDDGE